MGTKALVAFDTNHIKGYVFGTHPLKEIRGASSRLDSLNRIETVEIAQKTAPGATKIYANGGSALFLVDTAKAEQFGQAVQRRYRERTGGGASITYAVQPLPDKYDTYNIPEIMDADMPEVLELLNRRIQIAGVSHAEPIASPSHPFLATCSSCGTVYAEEIQPDPDDPDDPDDPNSRYCRVCLEKRWEDRKIRDDIPRIIRIPPKDPLSDKPLWEHVLGVLNKQKYDLSAKPKRPDDFNILATLIQGKEYLGLIYADANGMGKAREQIKSLQQLKMFAETVDNAVFEAVGQAIAEHLPVKENLFPFDILAIGGDDIVIAVPAAKALQVARTLADEFYKQTQYQYTLSVGVVLAPAKYPFRLQRELADEVLKAAKKAGSAKQLQQKEQANNKNEAPDPSYINFLVVTGSTSLMYKDISRDLQRKNLPYGNPDEFYATMRPYTLDDLAKLLGYIDAGHKERLGRTKLHQLREAILRLNRTTTILEALAAIRNWRANERRFIEGMLEAWDTRDAQKKRTETLFPWVRRPGEESIYETPLLDFIELYDFVAAGGGENA